jgi:predicted DNA-binding antitoxin AbrB/MazE fold protein
MHQKFEVVYENGVLRPLEPLPSAIHGGSRNHRLAAC